MEDEDYTPVKLGTNALQKCEIRDGKQLVAWDCAQDCVPDACPIGNTCLYAHKTAVCAVQVEYLQAYVDMILRTYRFLDEGDMFKVGMQIVPLYAQLCKMKIVEKGVGSMVYEDAKGNTRIHPIYKEIRDTMKTISAISRDIGFMGAPNMSLPGGIQAETFVNGRAGYGDPNHYANITKGADNKRDVTR